jgi:uncharacterized protein (DUF433 family)
MAQLQLIPTAKAAFIAQLSDRHMNRVFDERLLPAVLIDQQGGNRLFTKLAAAFATFYFTSDGELIAAARRRVLEELTDRVAGMPAKDDLFCLVNWTTVDWKVHLKTVEVDLAPFVRDAVQRAMDVEQADELVVSDPEIMGGTPVFKGTRVPLEMVLASIAAGIDRDRLKASYPFLTDGHIKAARTYEEVNPRRGRPRRLAERNPDLERRVVRTVRRANVA